MGQVDVVRDGDGGVRISSVTGREEADREGTGREDPGLELPVFARAVLEVAGAVLTLSAVDGPGLPSADVHDPALAQQWLWAVYGERVASAVHACATGTGGSAPARVTVDETALAVAAGRLAFGHWASRWWPASYLDGIPAPRSDLLAMESAALTHQCQQLFDPADEQDDDCAARLIEEHAAVLDLMVDWWRSAPAQRAAQGTAQGTVRHLERVLRLVDAAADAAGLDGPALRRLRTSLDRGRPADGAPVPVLPGDLFARPSGYALAAGGTPSAAGRVMARGTGVNDWCRYPPDLVDAAESSISWTARAVGARRMIEVAVAAVGPATVPAVGVPLAAEIRLDGLVVNRLRLERRDGLWSGAADVELSGAESGAQSAARIEVGVLLPGFDPGFDPGVGAGPGRGAEGRAVRDSVRSLARRRLAATGGQFLAETAAASADEDF